MFTTVGSQEIFHGKIMCLLFLEKTGQINGEALELILR